jgi:hypothetical protein
MVFCNPPCDRLCAVRGRVRAGSWYSCVGTSGCGVRGVNGGVECRLSRLWSFNVGVCLMVG